MMRLANFRPTPALLALCALALWAAALSAAEPRVKLAPNGAVLVDGKPFLPIFVWAQPSSALEMHKALGVNTMHPGEKEESDPIKAYLDKLQANGMLALVNDGAYKDEIKGHPAILAWTVEHEPDGATPAPYKPNLAGDGSIIWIEGEGPKENTLKPAGGWLNLKSAQLSGEHWLTCDDKAEGQAVYEFEVKKAGKYNLWVREFTKTWANPTNWQIDDQPAQDTPRELRSVNEESANLGEGRGANWCKYATVDLTEGKHKLTIKVVPGRTVGDPKKEPAPAAIWAIDVFCFTTADKFPPRVVADPLPTRLPEVEKEHYEQMKKRDPNCLTWNIFSGSFFGPYSQGLPQKYYDEWLRWADIASFDLYPVTGWNQPGRLAHVGLATRKLVSMARKGQPVWTIVEASDQELSWTAPTTKGPTAEEMRAEVWMAIASGAKGIGYFTIAFGRGKSFKWNNLTDEVKAEMKRTNGELTELAAPILLGDTDKALTTSGDETKDKEAQGHAIMAIRKDYEGKTYVVAVNVTREPVRPMFKVEEAPGGSVEVFRENRKVELKDAVELKNPSFTDAFKPLEVHIYILSK